MLCDLANDSTWLFFDVTSAGQLVMHGWRNDHFSGNGYQGYTVLTEFTGMVTETNDVAERSIAIVKEFSGTRGTSAVPAAVPGSWAPQAQAV